MASILRAFYTGGTGLSSPSTICGAASARLCLLILEQEGEGPGCWAWVAAGSADLSSQASSASRAPRCFGPARAGAKHVRHASWVQNTEALIKRLSKAEKEMLQDRPKPVSRTDFTAQIQLHSAYVLLVVAEFHIKLCPSYC